MRLNAVMFAIFGMAPRSATVRNGLLIWMDGVPSGRPVIAPLSVMVRIVPLSLRSNVGVPWKRMLLPT